MFENLKTAISYLEVDTRNIQHALHALNVEHTLIEKHCGTTLDIWFVVKNLDENELSCLSAVLTRIDLTSTTTLTRNANTLILWKPLTA